MKTTTEYRVGDIVRYSPNWCSPEERKYQHVLRERRMNPVTGEMTRWLIETINSGLTLNPTEVVGEEMLEPVGFQLDPLSESIGIMVFHG